MAHILQGQVVALFAFDVGYEVSLEQLGRLFSTIPAQPLSRKKQTPSYLQYARPPQILNLGKTAGWFVESGSIQATVFDFGVVSLAYRWPLTESGQNWMVEDLPRLSHDLYRRNLEVQAREQVENLMRTIAPTITKPSLSKLVEDYYLFIIEQLDQPVPAEGVLRQYAATLANTLRFETATLSLEQQAEALSQKISYYDRDLVIVDWNAAIIYDPDYEDTVSVLELLNAELLEARYMDAQLDKRIAEFANLARQRTEWPIPLRTPYRQVIQELAELRIESSLLTERVDNSLKLIGDLYLARVHAAAAQRLYLQEWERGITHKLEIIADLYQLLTDRVRTAQSHTLELAVIALILVELCLAIFT